MSTKTRTITLLDLFSGIGGFHLGLEMAGFDVISYYSEIDRHAKAIYKKHYPTATALGSVTDVRGAALSRAIDIITFGSPCQGFSNAGRNGGLSDERSGLIRHAIRLIDECRPRVFIWENVKGAISRQHSADFWEVVRCLTDLGSYRLEWQLLNTEWVLPQNRERIYLVGHLAAPGGSWCPVFPFREEHFGADERTANTAVVRTLTGGGHSEGRHSGMTLLRIPSATASGYEVATDGDSINMAQPNSHTRRGRVGHGKAHTIDTGQPQGVVVPNIHCLNGGENQTNRVYAADGIGPTLRSMAGGMSPKIEVPRVADRTPAHTSLSKRYYGTEGVANTIHTATGSNGNTDQHVVVPKSESVLFYDPEHEPIGKQRIRRLTEIECERLQGFPDDWTKCGDYDGTTKEVASTNRYKALGNAVTAHIAALVAQRLHAGLALHD
jgi:DNA (cytosine-5)-methyltransferase 1